MSDIYYKCFKNTLTSFPNRNNSQIVSTRELHESPCQKSKHRVKRCLFFLSDFIDWAQPHCFYYFVPAIKMTANVRNIMRIVT